MASYDDRKNFTLTVAAAGSVSGAVAIGGLTAVGLVLPATGSGDFDADTARLQFQVSADGTTFSALRDNDGTLVELTIAENNTLGATHLDPSVFAAWRWIKVALFEDDSTTAQTQTAQTTFTLIAAKVSG